MKIGIITYHRALNYGAVLQCYALQQILTKLGHSVKIIDFRQPVIENLYALDFKLSQVAKALIYFHPRSLCAIYKHQKTVLRFRRFTHRYLNCTLPCIGNNLPKDFDAYIIGSDQMWSFNCVGGYEPVYFGQFKREPNSKLYGYAISSCGDFMEIMPKSQICELLDCFSRYSLREHNIAQKLSILMGKDVPICLDPTLLIDAEDWNPLVNQKYQHKNYVFLYQIRGGNGNSIKVAEEARKFAEKHNLRLVDMSKRNHSVEDFVSAIKYAKYVFTTSFHATVFSIIFGIPFFTFKMNDGHDGRYVDLLCSLDICHHLVDLDKGEIDFKIHNNDRNKTLERLLKLRQNSLNFLMSI